MTTPAPTQRFRCSIAARERGDVPVGTAVPAPYWMLVGHPGPWPPKPIATEPLTEVAAELSARLNAVGARLQLIRRHGRQGDTSDPSAGQSGRLEEGDAPEQPVFLVDVRRGLVGRATWREPSDLVAIAERFDDLPDPTTEPLFLVCTHARKDVCCAIDGRVVAAVLDDVLPGAVWETTHLGGDRFAGNVAILPEGSMYGRLDGDVAPEVVLGHLDGRVDLDRWRGRSSWSPAAQVAVHALLDEAGGRLDEVSDPVVTALDQHRWQVDVDLAGATHRRVVTRTMSEAHQLTCTGGSKPQALFEVVQA